MCDADRPVRLAETALLPAPLGVVAQLTSLPYWVGSPHTNLQTLTAPIFGSTVPFSVAEVCRTEVAASVLPVGVGAVPGAFCGVVETGTKSSMLVSVSCWP